MNFQSLIVLIKKLTLAKKNELGLTLGYLAIVIILHWKLHPDLSIIYFLGGGILGVYFLDLADLVFKISPSPYRNVFFQAVFILMTLFVLTSSGSLFGSGLVLAIYLSMILGQFLELKEKGNLSDWFSLIKKEIDMSSQRIYLTVVFVIFLLVNLLFI